MKNNKQKSRINVNRRRCLQTIAATGGLIASTPVGIVGATSETSFDKRYQSALQVRENKGQEAFFEHLERVGLSYRRRIERFKVSKEDSDGPGTQSINKSNLDLNSSLVYDCDNSDHIYTDMWWEIDDLCAGSSNFASRPRDVVGFTWSDTDYKYITGTAYTGDYVCYEESNSECGEYDHDGGIAALHDDSLHSEQEASCGGSISSYFGGKLYIRSDDEPPYTRRVDTHYKHYYQDISSCSLPGISFGTGGIMVDWPDCSPDTWTKEIYETEDKAKDVCDDPIEP